jgi:hypothetical protein
LQNWQDIWSVNKSEFKTASIERGAIRRGPDNLWHYFTSFVHPSDGRWCVAALRGTDPAHFYSKNVEFIFTAKPLGLEGIKDPWILHHDDLYYMFVSIALPAANTTAQSHATQDIYNTGECLSATGLATSPDLDRWEWKGVVFRPEGGGWDRYCRRINSIVPLNDNFLAFYDGSAGHQENYEEKTGIAFSSNLRSWRPTTPVGPTYISPHGSHSLRYMDAQVQGPNALVFYECARPDGAHELRLLTMESALFFALLERQLPAELRSA